jgi:hypothetical protein
MPRDGGSGEGQQWLLPTLGLPPPLLFNSTIWDIKTNANNKSQIANNIKKNKKKIKKNVAISTLHIHTPPCTIHIIDAALLHPLVFTAWKLLVETSVLFCAVRPVDYRGHSLGTQSYTSGLPVHFPYLVDIRTDINAKQNVPSVCLSTGHRARCDIRQRERER